MRLKVWLKRIKGLKIRGLHRKKAKDMHKSKSVKAKPTLNVSKSPVYVSGNLSLPNLQEENLSLPNFLSPPLMNQKAPYVLTQRMFTLSPLSPLPSPALASTPTGHNTPLSLKDLLGFEAVTHCRSKKPSAFAEIAATLRCGKVESPSVDSSLSGVSKGLRDGQQNHSVMMKDYENEGSLQGSTAKWTGICRCVLVNVEKRFVKTCSDARKEQTGMPQMRSTLNTHAKQPSALSNGNVKITRLSMQTRKSDASTERESASLRRENVVEKPGIASSLDGGKPARREYVVEKPSIASSLDRGKPGKEHASVSISTSSKFDARSALPKQHLSHANDRKFTERQQPAAVKPPYVCDPASMRCTTVSALPKQHASLTKSVDFFVVERGGPSEPSSVSSLEKIKKRGSQDAKNVQGDALPLHGWLKDGKTHQDAANQSCELASEPICPTIDSKKLSELGSDEEKESLLQADSYESSETFSISSHSPWLNEPSKQVASSYTSVDFEAHARPWISKEFHASLIENCASSVENCASSTENHTPIARFQCKSDFSHGKSKRADAKAIRRSYHKAFMQQSVSTMVSTNRSNTDTFEIIDVNQAFNAKKNARKACTQQPVTTHQSKSDTIILPSEINNANQELNPSSKHAFDAKKGVGEAVQGSLAVEKRSRDPYFDFTDSMLDMILQNHMCSSKELEGLLQCFLSLNSLEHHDVIVQAFTEVWEKVVVGKDA